jgi:hypothetical protein
VAFLEDGAVLVMGRCQEGTVFGEGEENETIIEGWGSFLARYQGDGNLDWAMHVGQGSVHDMAVLDDGSILAAGTFHDGAIFGLGTPEEVTLESQGESDALVLKLAADGSLVWITGGGGPDYDWCRPIDVFADGSCVVCGEFWDSALFGAGEAEETELASAGYYDLFLARFGADGELEWATRAGGAEGAEHCQDVSVTEDGSILVAGRFEADAIFGEDEPEETTLAAEGGTDVFFAKYDSAGSLVWAKRVGGPDGDFSRGIDARPDGSFVLGGAFGESDYSIVSWATFGPGEIGETTLYTVDHTDIFVARYNEDGTLNVVTSAGGTDSEWSNEVVSLTGEDLVVCGSMRGTTTFGLGEPNETFLESAGSADVFLARYAL